MFNLSLLVVCVQSKTTPSECGYTYASIIYDASVVYLGEQISLQKCVLEQTLPREAHTTASFIWWPRMQQNGQEFAQGV